MGTLKPCKRICKGRLLTLIQGVYHRSHTRPFQLFWNHVAISSLVQRFSQQLSIVTNILTPMTGMSVKIQRDVASVTRMSSSVSIRHVFHINGSESPLSLVYCDINHVGDSFRCDNIKDCATGEDEDDCKFCDRDQFRCLSNDKCIPDKWRCDQYDDCPDSSDELDCFSEEDTADYPVNFGNGRIYPFAHEQAYTHPHKYRNFVKGKTGLFKMFCLFSLPFFL